MTTQVSDANFGEEVLSSKEPVLVDFWAEWCGPCRAIAPVLEELSSELQGKVKIVKLDAEQNIGIVTRYNVRSMPTLIVFQGGQPVDARVGSGQSRVQLIKWLDEFAA